MFDISVLSEMFYGAVYYLLIRKPAKLLAFGGNAYVFIAAIKATP